MFVKNDKVDFFLQRKDYLEKFSWYIQKNISLNWRPDFFQSEAAFFFEDRTFSKREVACKEESSIWTSSLSVKQGFSKRKRELYEQN